MIYEVVFRHREMIEAASEDEACERLAEMVRGNAAASECVAVECDETDLEMEDEEI